MITDQIIVYPWEVEDFTKEQLASAMAPVNWSRDLDDVEEPVFKDRGEAVAYRDRKELAKPWHLWGIKNWGVEFSVVKCRPYNRKKTTRKERAIK